MKTLYLNTYDPSDRFGLDAAQATKLFNHIEEQALASGWDKVERVETIDESKFYETEEHYYDAERFVNRLFEDFIQE
jgi:hypothetical protein